MLLTLFTSLKVLDLSWGQCLLLSAFPHATSWNHGMDWVGRDIKAYLLPTPCHRQGCHPSKGIFPPDAEAQGSTLYPINPP